MRRRTVSRQPLALPVAVLGLQVQRQAKRPKPEDQWTTSITTVPVTAAPGLACAKPWVKSPKFARSAPTFRRQRGLQVERAIIWCQWSRSGFRRWHIVASASARWCSCTGRSSARRPWLRKMSPSMRKPPPSDVCQWVVLPRPQAILHGQAVTQEAERPGHVPRTLVHQPLAEVQRTSTSSSY